MQLELTQDQYRDFANSYDAYQRYSDRFVRVLSICMVDALDLRENDRFVDLGGGTGIYSEAILQLVPLQHPITIVDPIAEMLAQVPQHLQVERVEMDALAYSRMPGDLDKVLMKNAVHYVDKKAELFSNLHGKLTQGGVLLVVNSPVPIDHPLFDAALDRSKTWYTDSETLVELLGGSGFEVETDSLDYDFRIPKYQYFQMVRERYLFLLASFTDEELEEGVTEMEKMFRDEDNLHFTSRFDFLTAVKC